MYRNIKELLKKTYELNDEADFNLAFKSHKDLINVIKENKNITLKKATELVSDKQNLDEFKNKFLKEMQTEYPNYGDELHMDVNLTYDKALEYLNQGVNNGTI